MNGVPGAPGWDHSGLTYTGYALIELPTDAEPVKIIQGDCLEVMATLSADSVDSIVTDPPYGLEFMGKEWDSFRGEAWRAGAGFSSPGIGERKTPWPSFGSGDSANATCETCGGRMRGANKCGCESPDWRVKGKPLEQRNGKVEQMRAFQTWCEGWSSAALRVLKPGGYMLAMGGTRTYHRLACAVEDAGFEVRDCLMWIYGSGFPKGKGCLKPAWEPILLCRKPGAKVLPLGIDECRVKTSVDDIKEMTGRSGAGSGYRKYGGGNGLGATWQPTAGRWPANLLHDGSDEVLEAFAAFGESKSKRSMRGIGLTASTVYGAGRLDYDTERGHDDTGTAARFFYCAKASRSERGDGNSHPTVKPLALMRWMVRLVTPSGGLVLDPFAGSGTTGKAALAEGRRAILIERDPSYVEIIRKRLAKSAGLFAEVS